MKVISRPRQTGKTTQLLYTSATVGIPILVDTKHRVEQLKIEADKLGISIPDPFTVDEIYNNRSEYLKGSEILVDDSHLVLGALLKHFGYTTKAITVCPD